MINQLKHLMFIKSAEDYQSQQSRILCESHSKQIDNHVKEWGKPLISAILIVLLGIGAITAFPNQLPAQETKQANAHVLPKNVSRKKKSLPHNGERKLALNSATNSNITLNNNGELPGRLNLANSSPATTVDPVAAPKSNKGEKEDFAAATHSARTSLSVTAEPDPPDSNNIVSGDFTVKVRSAADSTIRLGLAPGGVTLVEFPADDYVFARYPGDENFVTIDDSIKKRARPTDPLIFRPGAGFFVPDTRQKVKMPYGQITVQMISGAVFTFQIYPVKDLVHSATRVVVMYNAATISAERRRLGLPVDLNERKFQSKAEIAAQEEAANNAKAELSDNRTAEDESVAAALAPHSTPAVVTPQVQAERMLAEVAALSDLKWEFSKPLHGLMLAVKPNIQLLDNGRLCAYTIAVRNTFNVPVRLLTALPELVIETREDKKTAINRENLNLIASAGNLAENRYLDAYQTAVFVLVTEAPILGAKQMFSMQAANAAAADEPVSMPINVLGR